MKDKHNMLQEVFRNCKYCSLIFTSKEKLNEHLLDKHSKTPEPGMNQDEETESNLTKPTKIVLVKLRSLAWPCEVLKKENNILEVRNLSSGAILNVREADVEEFDIQKLGETKNWRLRKAFAEASYILKKA